MRAFSLAGGCQCHPDVRLKATGAKGWGGHKAVLWARGLGGHKAVLWARGLGGHPAGKEGTMARVLLRCVLKAGPNHTANAGSASKSLRKWHA